jgi:hypothetical protein
MTTETPPSHLWYLRRAGQVSGPFPAGQVSRYILLGRIHEDDELSQDRETWRPYRELPQLIPAVMREQHAPEELALARLHADERAHERRHASAAEDAKWAEQRRGQRRDPEPAELEHRRARHVAWAEAPAAVERPDRRLPVALGAAIVLGFAALYLWQSLAPPAAGGRDCLAAAAPGVNWNHCPLPGAALAGADLTGANLDSAVLSGARLERARLERADLRYASLVDADLRSARLAGADLTGALLRGANLRGADITGAKFASADLGQATWVDGRRCATGSIGACR